MNSRNIVVASVQSLMGVIFRTSDNWAIPIVLPSKWHQTKTMPISFTPSTLQIWTNSHRNCGRGNPVATNFWRRWYNKASHLKLAIISARPGQWTDVAVHVNLNQSLQRRTEFIFHQKESKYRFDISNDFFVPRYFNNCSHASMVDRSMLALHQELLPSDEMVLRTTHNNQTGYDIAFSFIRDQAHCSLSPGFFRKCLHQFYVSSHAWTISRIGVQTDTHALRAKWICCNRNRNIVSCCCEWRPLGSSWFHYTTNE
jgi:hypothetical protein